MSTQRAPLGTRLLCGARRQHCSRLCASSQSPASTLSATTLRPSPPEFLDTLSWSDWSAAFAEADAADARCAALSASLAEALAQENYGAASEAQAALSALQAADGAAGLLADFRQAVAEESYSRAATLRDAGLDLCGWWRGIEVGPPGSSGVPRGCVLRWAPDGFGRLSAVVAPPSLLALSARRAEAAAAVAELGAAPAVMELHVVRDSGAAGGFATRAVALCPPGGVAALVGEPEEEGGAEEEEQDGVRLSAALRSALHLPGAQQLAAALAALLPPPAPPPMPPVGLVVRRPLSLQRLGRHTLLATTSAAPLSPAPTRRAARSAWERAAAGAEAVERGVLAEDLRAALAARAKPRSPARARRRAGLRQEPAAPAEQRVLFTRLTEEECAGGDPLAGIFLGSFGPWGPEVLQLQRGRWGDGQGAGDEAEGEGWGAGRDCITAVKLTGDVNVPAGRASFRARCGPAYALPPADAYPPELGVKARYAGQGRAAGPGFESPRWVDGELLELDGKGGALTGGAELGLVWSVPGERRFLILFSRLHLPTVHLL